MGEVWIYMYFLEPLSSSEYKMITYNMYLQLNFNSFNNINYINYNYNNYYYTHSGEVEFSECFFEFKVVFTNGNLCF